MAASGHNGSHRVLFWSAESPDRLQSNTWWFLQITRATPQYSTIAYTRVPFHLYGDGQLSLNQPKQQSWSHPSNNLSGPHGDRRGGWRTSDKIPRKVPVPYLRLSLCACVPLSRQKQ